MVDTIKLSLHGYNTKWLNFNYSKFIKKGNHIIIPSIWNHMKRLIYSCIEGSYFPNFTIDLVEEKLVGLTLEFSVPKLLYGSSYYEYKEEDYDLLVRKLQGVLKVACIIGDTNTIQQFIVGKFAVCKNYALPKKLGKPYQLLWIINTTRLSPYYKKFKSTKYEAIEDDGFGYSLSASSARKGIVLYDKGQEIVANAHTKEEIALKNNFLWGDIQTGVLRVEATFRGITHCQEAFCWGNNKTKLTLWVLFTGNRLKDIMIREQNKVIKILKTKIIEGDVIYPIEEILKRLSKTDLTGKEQLQVASLLMFQQQAGDSGTKILFKKIYWEKAGSLRLMKVKRIVKRLKEDKALENGNISQLTKCMENCIWLL